jgi:hypothetical protein
VSAGVTGEFCQTGGRFVVYSSRVLWFVASQLNTIPFCASVMLSTGRFV